MKIARYIALLAVAMIMVACGSKKNLDASGSATKSVDTSTLKKLDYVRKVYSNATDSKNLVSKIDFTIDGMGKNISVVKRFT